VIGQVKWPPYQAIDKVQPPNSVNPKPFRHGNTELNSTKVDKCVESIKGQPQVGYDVFRTLWKHSEPTGNKLVAQQCVVTDCVMLMMVKRSPSYQATGKMQKPNSVNPKPFRHGNTELNSTKVDKCVETMGLPTQVVDDIVRATRKCVEMYRNATSAYTISSNNIRGRNRDDLIPGRSWYSYLAVPEHHRLVNRRPETVVMPLKKWANSVNAKAICYANAELNSEKSDKCVENKCSLTQVVKDMFRPAWKRAELTRNELALRS
jgi:hypothetical protein